MKSASMASGTHGAPEAATSSSSGGSKPIIRGVVFDMDGTLTVSMVNVALSIAFCAILGRFLLALLLLVHDLIALI